MGTRHTPGPWVVVEEPYDPEHDLFCRSIYSEGYNGLLIARADQDFSKADARLIAAAPELLEAADEALRCISNIDNAHASVRLLRAAIAKATQP